MATFAGEAFRFMAPDALLASGCTAGWLIVDEAAAIPGPLLRQLVSRFPRTLLTTTVQGYEGTGRGFLLKFCASFAHLRQFSLTTPIRWASGCPLEAAIARLLLFNDETFQHAPGGDIALESVSQESWRRQSALPEAMYQLLSGAHYRTSPLDLRRMMDAPGQHFTCARGGSASPERYGWWRRAVLSRRLARRCGPAIAVRAAIWWRSRWRRTAVAH